MQNSCMEVFVFSFFFLFSFFFFFRFSFRNKKYENSWCSLGHVLRRLIGSSGFLNQERESERKKETKKIFYMYIIYISLSLCFVRNV